MLFTSIKLILKFQLSGTSTFSHLKLNTHSKYASLFILGNGLSSHLGPNCKLVIFEPPSLLDISRAPSYSHLPEMPPDFMACGWCYLCPITQAQTCQCAFLCSLSSLISLGTVPSPSNLPCSPRLPSVFGYILAPLSLRLLHPTLVFFF